MHQLLTHWADTVKHWIDVLSISTLIATMTEHLPNTAAWLTVIWTVIRIWETKTVQGIVRRRRKAGKE